MYKLIFHLNSLNFLICLADDIALSANSFNFSAPILFPTNMNFDISALSDNLVEEDEETVTISIDSSNVSYSLGTPSSINVTIINIDGQF